MKYSIHVPSTLEEAFTTRSRVGGQYLAGGTVVLAIKKPVCDLVSLSRIPGLSFIERKGDCIEIGGGTTFDELDRSALLKERLTALWQASHELAGPQIRNVATIGGNIGSMSPSADSVTCYYRTHSTNVSGDKNWLYENTLKVLDQYSSHKLYKEARRIWMSHWFSALCYANKKEALRKLPELWSFSLPFLKRFPKLFIPKFLLKR